MAWRNESSLFKRKSDYSGKEIFSAFAPDVPVKVYEKEVWSSDAWDALTYGRDYSFSRPFFEQFRDLLRSVPLKNLNLVNVANSDFCNNATDPKNCYLIFNSKGAEDCMYGNGFAHTKDCVDISNVGKCERCYESFWLTNCSNTIFSMQCEASYNLLFCKNCIGCNDCFGCVGLRKKSYCVFNKQVTKEEYQKRVKEFELNSFKKLEEVKKKVFDFWLQFPNKYIEGYQNINVSGDYISHSKNVRDSFLVREGENLRYCQYVQELPGSKDCYDYTAWGDGNELLYECSACGIATSSNKFCYNVQEGSHHVEYSYMCANSSYLFACVGLRKKHYCVFNKQYSKEEYEKLAERIKIYMNDMPYRDIRGREYRYGEFFPIETSPFAYNDTLAHEHFPLTKEKAETEGYAFREDKTRDYKITKASEDLPDRIEDVADSILDDVIGCEHKGECNDGCATAFKIIPNELQFYRKMKLPLPRLCFRCRLRRRLEWRNPLELFNRACGCAGAASLNNVYKNTVNHSHGASPCLVTFQTSYAPDRPEIVYCEQCYNVEVA
jgi:hypothetical protein